MKRTCTTLVSTDTFGKSVANRFDPLTIEEYKDIIFNEQSKWIVCNNPKASGITAFATIFDLKNEHYSVTRSNNSPDIDELIDKELNKFKPTHSIILFNSSGKYSTLISKTETYMRSTIVNSILREIEDYGYAIIWKNTYFKVMPSDIIYLLLALLTPSLLLEFCDSYSVFDETSLNFILSNIDSPVTIKILKEIGFINRVPSLNNLMEIAAMIGDNEQTESTSIVVC